MFWVRTEGAPTRWTYFDVLGRAVLEVTQAFQSSADASFSAVCSYFDAAGRSERTSEPFFLRSPEGAGAPEFAEQPSPCSQGRLWTRLGYDAVGRPVKTTYPDDSLSEIGYAGLATTIIDQNGHARSERRNALGELVQATDAAGLRVSYAYAADGGLESVSRDGGRGALVTRFVYDALGRKIGQSDPDAGVWVYAYNAAGELIEQVDAKGNPIVQSPWEGQNWNPYAYVLNNPLSFTDPSGLITLKDAWRTVVGIVVAVYAPQFFATYMKMSGFWSTVAAGFSSGVVTSGSLKGGVYGAFSAGAFYGVGSANWPQAAPGEGALGTSLTSGALAGKTVVHGLVGGVMASLQGGKFGHGFVSAGITQLSSGAIDRVDPANPGISAGRVTVAALVGGTTSVLTGGKFANGALTAAFSRAFNDDIHKGNARERATKARALTNEFEKITQSELYDSIDEAETRFSGLALGPTRSLGLEFGADVYAVPTAKGLKFRLSNWHSSYTFGEDGYGNGVRVGYRSNTSIRAFMHTHPITSGAGLIFSDIMGAIEAGIDAFARHADGNLYTFSYDKWVAAGSPSAAIVYYDQQRFSR